MSHLEQLTPEDKSEVVKIAARLRDEEMERSAADQEQKAFVAAAQEMDLPEVYLERAAAELQQTRILNARNRLTKRRALIGTAIALVVLAGGWRATHLPIPQVSPVVLNSMQFELNINQETHANFALKNMDGRNNVAVLHVDQFADSYIDRRQYFANLNISPGVSSLRGYQSTSFFSKAAGLPNLRLYIEASPTERWRSPELHTTTDWKQNKINFSQFEHQIKDPGIGTWHSADGSLPDHVDRFSFKVGTYMNSIDSHGDLAIDDVEIR